MWVEVPSIAVRGLAFGDVRIMRSRTSRSRIRTTSLRFGLP